MQHSKKPVYDCYFSKLFHRHLYFGHSSEKAFNAQKYFVNELISMHLFAHLLSIEILGLQIIPREFMTTLNYQLSRVELVC